jgi:hypothetical protein
LVTISALEPVAALPDFAVAVVLAGGGVFLAVIFHL